MQNSMLDAISQSLYGVEEQEKTIAEIALEALDEGYERIKARFEGYGDEMENMYYKFSKDQRWLYLTMETGESVHLDVGGGGCFVTENGDNDCRCYLDYHNHILSFSMPTVNKIQNFMDEFPAVVYDYEDVEEVLEALEEKVKQRNPDFKFEQKEAKERGNDVNAQAEARKARVKAQQKLKDKKSKKTLDQILESIDSGRASYKSGKSIGKRSVGMSLSGRISGSGALEGHRQSPQSHSSSWPAHSACV